MDERATGHESADLLTRLGRIHAVSWEWRDEEAVRACGLIPGSRAAGVIAQDVECAFPELVKSDEQGYKHVDYNGLIGVLIEAVKELDSRLKALEQASEQQSGQTK